jgi:hypothetical protein
MCDKARRLLLFAAILQCLKRQKENCAKLLKCVSEISVAIVVLIVFVFFNFFS